MKRRAPLGWGLLVLIGILGLLFRFCTGKHEIKDEIRKYTELAGRRNIRLVDLWRS